MPRHVCIWSDVEEGIEACVDCGQVRRFSVPDAPQLAECVCGRGLARFVWDDSATVCASCFNERLSAAKRGAA